MAPLSNCSPSLLITLLSILRRRPFRFTVKSSIGFWTKMHYNPLRTGKKTCTCRSWGWLLGGFVVPQYTFFIRVTYVHPHIGIFIRQSVSQGRLKGHRRSKTRVRLMYAEPAKGPLLLRSPSAILPVRYIQYAGPIILYCTSEAEKQPYYPMLMKLRRSVHWSALLLLTYKYH